MFWNIHHVTLAWWQVLLHLHHSFLNCALDFVNFHKFKIFRSIQISPDGVLSMDRRTRVCRGNCPVPSPFTSIATGSEFRTILYGKNFQVSSRNRFFEKQMTWWLVSIHQCICDHVEVPIFSSLVEVWWPKISFIGVWIIEFQQKTTGNYWNTNLVESFASWETIVLSGIVNVVKNVCTLFVEFDKNIFQKFWLEDIFNSPKVEKISVSQYHT